MITSGNKSQSGFTLIEAVVAASVFVFVVSAVIGVYISTLRLDSRTRAQRAILDNSRFIMDFLSKEVRNGHIDYNAAACGGVVTSDTDLCLVNQDNEAEHFYLTGNNLAVAKTAGTANLNSSNVLVTNVRFLVAPTSDPLVAGSPTNEQPHVTVILDMKTTSDRDPVPIHLQSTFSENYYPSR